MSLDNAKLSYPLNLGWYEGSVLAGTEPKQTAYVACFLLAGDGDRTRAARDAGYSTKSSNASQLHRRPSVQRLFAWARVRGADVPEGVGCDLPELRRHVLRLALRGDSVAEQVIAQKFVRELLDAEARELKNSRHELDSREVRLEKVRKDFGRLSSTSY